MSTSTTNYGFTKPDPGEPSGADVIANNIQLSDHVINRIDNATSTGRDNKHMVARKRTSALSGIAANTTTPPDLTWTRISGSATYTSMHNLDNASDFGTTFFGDSGYWEIYTPGYYRITWNIRLQMAAATMTEGFVRAALVHYDSASSNSAAVKNSFVIQAMDTQLGITDIGTDLLVKATLPSDTSGDIYVSGGTNQYPYAGEPYHGMYLAFAHDSSTAATASIVVNETYLNIEWLRGL